MKSCFQLKLKYTKWCTVQNPVRIDIKISNYSYALYLYVSGGTLTKIAYYSTVSQRIVNYEAEESGSCEVISRTFSK